MSTNLQMVSFLHVGLLMFLETNIQTDEGVCRSRVFFFFFKGSGLGLIGVLAFWA